MSENLKPDPIAAPEDETERVPDDEVSDEDVSADAGAVEPPD